MQFFSSAQEATAIIQSNDNVFIHTASAAPLELIQGMMSHAHHLHSVNLFHLHTEGIAPYALPEFQNTFKINALFVGGNVRKAIQSGRGSYIPVFLSEAPLLFKRNIINLDIALITVSPPDKHGYCSLGVSVDTTKAAIRNANIVIAQINQYMPRTHGDGIIHISEIDRIIEHNEPLKEMLVKPPNEVQMEIGRHVAGLVEDRATLQMGIGAIPNAVLACLDNHKDLGIHTEMFSDGVFPLVERGVITNKYKKKHAGKMLATFLAGSQKLYDFVDDNPMVTMAEADYVNSTAVIKKNPKVTAINSAIEIDLTGQVCADSIGSKIYSGVGGQMDFIRGASLSEGGKPIIALPSTTRNGTSRIVSQLKMGAGVVTTRAHIHYVVTEYGVAYLFGKSLKDRAKALIKIAHPDHREALEKMAFELNMVG